MPAGGVVVCAMVTGRPEFRNVRLPRSSGGSDGRPDFYFAFVSNFSPRTRATKRLETIPVLATTATCRSRRPRGTGFSGLFRASPPALTAAAAAAADRRTSGGPPRPIFRATVARANLSGENQCRARDRTVVPTLYARCARYRTLAAVQRSYLPIPVRTSRDPHRSENTECVVDLLEIDLRGIPDDNAFRRRHAGPTAPGTVKRHPEDYDVRRRRRIIIPVQATMSPRTRDRPPAS